MLRAYKYRIYPNKEQEQKFVKTFGCCRVVWNDCVNAFNSDYDVWTLENKYGIDVPNNYKKEYRTAKQMKEEFNWMSEVSSGALNYSIQNFRAYQNLKYKNYGKVGFPKFKNRHSKQSYSLQHPRFEIKEGKIRLEKIGWVKLVESQKINEDATYKSVTVSKNKANQYYVSVLVDTHIEQLPKTDKTVGIDLGLKEFAVTSDNVHIDNPHFLRENQAKIKRLQMWQSKKVGSKKGQSKSRLWRRLQMRINKEYNRLYNRRLDFTHKLSTQMVKDYDIICLEDLAVDNLVKNHNLASAIADVKWGDFRRQIEYKCKWYGKEMMLVDRFYPSSKTCSCCGHIVDEMPLNVRMFACPECGLTIDRDYNAAMNIKQTCTGSTGIRPLSLEVTKDYEALTC
ncbi:transposase [Bacteroidia bacterium]|nr:transposase [Bacteroidia bacterium]